jgi:hypothetical protein
VACRGGWGWLRGLGPEGEPRTILRGRPRFPFIHSQTMRACATLIAASALCRAAGAAGPCRRWRNCRCAALAGECLAPAGRALWGEPCGCWTSDTALWRRMGWGGARMTRQGAVETASMALRMNLTLRGETRPRAYSREDYGALPAPLHAVVSRLELARRIVKATTLNVRAACGARACGAPWCAACVARGLWCPCPQQTLVSKP